MIAAFLQDAGGFFVVFDLTSDESFLEVNYWLDQIKIHGYCEDPDVILVGNKADCEDARVISRERAQELADKYSVPYIEISACTGQNVEESIAMLVEKVLLRMEKDDTTMSKIRRETSTYRF
ncbi:unnamed protein product [Adineta steineri]|uniref:Uncharacterized protein n=1 Tax=Adineta steineri TaxID=433720 RepID=A0A814S9M0_9BILA|nr:unnamed protein product [Adineta steineri]CAF3938576.1 unnamed protein product [Adineta steineri]